MPFDTSSPETRLDIAVVGSGIAGMSAAWLLAQRHAVTLYERDDRLGGHSHTVDAEIDGADVPVDTGFIVYNEQTYPNLTALFRHLDVPVADSDMSFAASLGDGALEYSGTDFNGLFGQRGNMVSLRFWRMLIDLVRFYRTAPGSLSQADCADLSLGAYLDRHGYSDAFVEDHLLPMAAAIWSTSVQEIRAYPLRAFVRFFVSHGLLNLVNRPQWRTVKGGSREYVRRLTEPVASGARYGGVRQVSRFGDRVEILTADGGRYRHDQVVIAAHADDALAMLEHPTNDEQRLLGAWRYTQNRAFLHTDPGLMPKRRRVWASWNFIGAGTGDDRALCLTYWMNQLQPLQSDTDFFVTLNPATEPDARRVLREIDYSHPFFDKAALATQPDLWALQGIARTWYCGSYFGYGFHEDGLQSGLAVAEQLGGVKRPWSVAQESGRIHLPRTGLREAA